MIASDGYRITVFSDPTALGHGTIVVIDPKVIPPDPP